MYKYCSFLLVFFFYSNSGLSQSYEKIDLSSFAPLNPTVVYDNLAPTNHQYSNGVESVVSFNETGTQNWVRSYDEHGFIHGQKTLQHTTTYQELDGNKILMTKIPSFGYSSNETYTYGFNSEKNIISATIHGYSAEDDIKYQYLYEDDMMVAKVESRARKKSNAPTTFSSDTLHYVYDEKKRIIQSGSSFTYEYSIKDNQLHVIEKFKGDVIKRSVYDDYGQLVSFQNREKTPITYTYKIETDKNNNIIKKEVTSNTGKKNLTGYRIIYKNGDVSEPKVSFPIFTTEQPVVLGQFSDEFITVEGFTEKKKMEGPARMYNAGKYQAGQFKKGVLNGAGSEMEMLNPLNFTFGEFKNGQLHGYALTINLSTKEISRAGIFKNGKLVENLLPEGDIPIESASEEGLVKDFSSSVEAFGFVKDGKKVGVWVEPNNVSGISATYYNSYGQIFFYDGAYNNGRAIGEQNNGVFEGKAYIQTVSGMQGGLFENGELKTEIPFQQ